jgi:polyhydroxybutyrate depolymerase
VDGLERTYTIHIPPGVGNRGPIPLVLVFHGFQENGSYARTYTGFDALADANGFVVVYANGTGSSSSLSWNAGGCCGYAIQNDVDDEAFIEAIIADVETFVPVDPARIYATGFSNGALLSYRLACEMSDTFAAVAPVAGVLITDPCQPQEAVSILHVHGLQDNAVPYEGGSSAGAGLEFPPVEESLAAWTALDGCSGSPQVEVEGIVTHTTYGNCQAGTAVELYTIDGMGHSWPSPYITTPSISQTIWEFFAAHPKP